MILSEWKRLSEDFSETLAAKNGDDIVNEPAHYA